MTDPIVITGAGVISSIGDSFEAFGEKLFTGSTGIGPGRLADFGDGEQTVVCEVRDFVPQKWLGPKGIRVLDRSARLLCVAAQMALESVGHLPSAESEGDSRVGLVCGTVFGSVHSITSFDWSGIEDGVKYVNPMAFPNTVINSPAGQAAIKHKLGGINSTISAGLASSLYAIAYAADFLGLGRADLLIAGGVEELAEESYLGFKKNQLLSSRGVASPFCERRDGVVLGEGSALFAMETAERAASNGHRVLGRFRSFGSAHDAYEVNVFRLSGEGAARAIGQALKEGGLSIGDIGFIVSGASGSRAGDQMELEALSRVFGTRLKEIPLCAPKAAFGESLGASGALGVATALHIFQREEVPPTPGIDSPPAGLALSSEAQPATGDFGLITGFSCDGNNAALVLQRA